VLLSPACTSWDMYKNYHERGEDFKRIVKTIVEANSVKSG
jgi:UDP-N-acetylmuramoylalanine--D-glutamate ligase